MFARSWFVVGALLAALGVANGAFAAHGLERQLLEIYEETPELIGLRLQQYETGVRYQMYHSLGLMLLGVVAVRRPTPLWHLAGFGFVAGCILFSGMLYILALTDTPRLGAIVPIGGVSFIVGWLSLAAGAFTALKEETPSTEAKG
jgi:uncharacterized membrane protein YgdD (TMEM256/DUF423 family)